MSVFVDTSALYAILDADDDNHAEAARVFRRLLGSSEPLTTHSYVVVEAVALTQRRLGAEAVRTLLQELLPALDVTWVDESTHGAGGAALLAALPTAVSLVDYVSFEVMRRGRIERAFAFDADFATAGFSVLL